MAQASQAFPSVVFDEGFEVEAGRPGLAHVAFGSLLVEGVELEQDGIGRLGGQLLGPLSGSIEVSLGNQWAKE